MIDDSGGAYDAARVSFGNQCNILMTWFHVMLNVKKHKHLIGDEHWNQVLKSIRELRFSRQLEFESKKAATLLNWRAKGLIEFSNYFSTQWLQGSYFYIVLKS